MRERWQWWLALVVCCALVVVWLMLPPQWPGPEGTPQPPKGFQRQCQIVRDKHDVPHIKAPNQASAFYCWGRVHAADRGWQMDYLRRLGRGRVAEHYGGFKNIQRDFFMRLLGFEEIADDWRAHMARHSPRRYRLFAYYVWGINDGFAKLRKTQPHHPIYRKYGFRLAPWRISDSMILLLLQSFSMTSMSFTNDLKHARLRRHLGKRRYLQLYGPDRGLGPLDHTILKAGEHPYAQPIRRKGPGFKKLRNIHIFPRKHGFKAPSRTPKRRLASNQATAPTGPRRAAPQPRSQVQKALALLEQSLRELPWLGPTEPGAVGSNSWVVSPKLTRRKHPLLANDTHMAITTPNFWHEAHLKAPGLDVTGFAVPGLPTIVLGHNRQLAWGMTAGQSNSADVMMITPQRRHFTLGHKSYQLHRIRPVVWLRKGPLHVPVFWKTFARSRLGPILPLPGQVPGQRLLLRWVAYHVKAPPLAMMALMRSTSVKQAERHLRHMTMPNLSAVLADNKGNIGFRQFGLIPKRRDGIHGLLDPDKPSHRWGRFLNHEEMPWVINPPRGYVVTANNRPFPGHYPYFLGHAFASGFRASRISAMLALSKSHTLKSMRWIQRDTRVPMADRLLAQLIRMLHLRQTPQLTARQRRAVTLLKRWGHRATKASVGASIFRVWLETLRRRLFRFDRVKKANGKGYDYPGDLGLLRAIQRQLTVYTRMSLEQELHKALQEALDTLEKAFGKDMKGWQWGKVHRIHFSSLLGADAPFHPPAQARDGDFGTVNVGYHTRGALPYKNLYAASVRFLVELGPQIRSFAALAGSQRDHTPQKLTAEHKRWLKGQYRRRFFTDKEIKANQASAVQLKY